MLYKGVITTVAIIIMAIIVVQTIRLGMGWPHGMTNSYSPAMTRP